MSMICLKSQWHLRLTDQGPLLLSETQRHPQPPALASLLERLVKGVHPTDLSDDEFAQVELLNSSGFLDTGGFTNSFTWELQGAPYSTVLEQLSHVTFSVCDLTNNGVGEDVRTRLKMDGMVEAEPSTERICLVFVDSYEDIRNLPTTTVTQLPVLCNRMRLWIGPLQFQWTRPRLYEQVAGNDAYIDRLNYVLEERYDQLQRAVLAALIPQIVGTIKLEYVRCMVEYNMMALRSRIWPV